MSNEESQTAIVEDSQKAFAEISKKLKAYFPESELEWRPQTIGETKSGKPFAMVLCYVQARAIENRLDEVVGAHNWQNEIRVEGENIIARLGVKFGNEWVWKENGASQTDIEAFKGGISGAIKRVASSGFGIGRYLYELETTFADCQREKPEDASGWVKARDKKVGEFWWKIPRIPNKFLPKQKTDANTIARNFTKAEAESAKEWAIALSENAYELALERFKIDSLEKLEYTRKAEFVKLVKEIARSENGEA